MNARTLLTLAGFASVAVLIGQITVDAEPGGGKSFRSRSASGSDPIAAGGIGPDVMVWRLSDVANWGTVGDITAYSVGTVSCNVGDEEVSWRDGTPQFPDNRHPVIAQNMYRLADGRFEQIGQSWLKHGFFALDGNECLDCQANGSGDWLGVGCSDPYNAWLNGSQNGLGPKYQVNPFTGDFPYPPDDPPYSGNVARRLQVHTSDVIASKNPDASYWLEGHYIAADDAQAGNGYNNVSYRGVNLLADGRIGSFAGGTVQKRSAISAWKVAEPEVDIVQIDLPGDGRLFLGYKATDLGNGYWEYEYALYNMNSERAAGSIIVPVADLLDVLNDGFHDVDYHSGEPFDGADWVVARNAGTIAWATESFGANENANAVRWGTLYNFRFQADAPPVETEIEIGLFKPGAPEMVIVTAIGPEAPLNPCPADLVVDGAVGVKDLLFLLGAWGPCP